MAEALAARELPKWARWSSVAAARPWTVGIEEEVLLLDPETALRRDLPLLLALSANSPYWRGHDAGFASVRTPIFSMFPRTGIDSSSTRSPPQRPVPRDPTAAGTEVCCRRSA